MQQKDLRGKASQKIIKVYEDIHSLFLRGKAVKVSEHKSGFPAITIDCEDIHIIADILSLEQWWAMKKQEGK